MATQDAADASRELRELGNPTRLEPPVPQKKSTFFPVAAEVMVRLRFARSIFPAQTIDVAHKQQRNSGL